MAYIINQARIRQRSLIITLLDLKNAFGEIHHNRHTAKPGPDSDPYKTRTREKPGLDTRTYLRKKPDLSPQNPDSINKKKLNSKLDSLKNVV